jgi:hypothetical protein
MSLGGVAIEASGRSAVALGSGSMPISPPPSVWAVVKASALSSLGKPLLLTYLALLVFGPLVVLGSLIVMRLG